MENQQPLTEEELQQMIMMGMGLPGMSEQAKLLREGAQPQMIQSGRIATAPHPLEYIGGLAKLKTAKGLDDEAARRKQEQQAMILRGIMRGNQPMGPQGMFSGINPAARGQGLYKPENF